MSQPSKARQGGQAMIETIVACIALIPLFFLIPLVGKYIDIKLATIAASRKLAFECTVNAAVCQDLSGNAGVVDDLRSQYFRGNGEEVLASDVPADDVSQDPNANPLWVDRKGKYLIEDYSDIGAEVDPLTFNPLGNNAFGQIAGSVRPRSARRTIRRACSGCAVQEPNRLVL
jgi:hypothetical protein